MAYISIVFTGYQDSISFIDASRKKVENATIRLGRLTMQRFHQEIKSRTKRRGSTGNLISSIRTEIKRSKNLLEVGIGNKDTMTKEAPYWYVVNYGATVTGKKFIPPVTGGTFEGGPPQKGAPRVQRWGSQSRGGYIMKPKRFRPMHYIGRTNSWLANFHKEFLLVAIQ